MQMRLQDAERYAEDLAPKMPDWAVELERCIRQCAAEEESDWKIGNIWPSGWKFYIHRVDRYNITNNDDIVKFEEKNIHYVFQWIFLATAKGNFFYVNVPSYTGGKFGAGATFDLADQSVDLPFSQPECDAMCENAFWMLSDLLRTNGIEYEPPIPLQRPERELPKLVEPWSGVK